MLFQAKLKPQVVMKCSPNVDFSFDVIRELLFATLEASVTNDLTSYAGSSNYSAIRNVIMGCSNGLLASWLAV